MFTDHNLLGGLTKAQHFNLLGNPLVFGGGSRFTMFLEKTTGSWKICPGIPGWIWWPCPTRVPNKDNVGASDKLEDFVVTSVGSRKVKAPGTVKGPIGEC